MQDPGYRAFMAVVGGFGLVMATVQLVSAYGLFQMRPWGRKLTLGWAGLVFVQVVAGLAGNMIFLWQPMLASGAPQAPLSIVSGLFGTLLGTALPAAALVILTRPKVVRAFRAAGEGAPAGGGDEGTDASPAEPA